MKKVTIGAGISIGVCLIGCTSYWICNEIRRLKSYNQKLKKENKELKKGNISERKKQVAEHIIGKVENYIDDLFSASGNLIEEDDIIESDEIREALQSAIGFAIGENISCENSNSFKQACDKMCEKLVEELADIDMNPKVFQKVQEAVYDKFNDYIHSYSFKYTIENTIDNSVKELVAACANDFNINEEKAKNLKEKIEEKFKEAIININRFDVKISSIASEKINSMASEIIEQLQLQPKDYQTYQHDIKEQISKIVKENVLDYDIKKLVQKAIKNEVFNSLPKNNKFWESIDFETGVLRNEVITLAEYHKFCIEMQANPKVEKYDFLVRRNVGRPYRIWAITKYTSGKVTARSGDLTENASFEEKISQVDYEVILNRRRSDGYVIMTEPSYLQKVIDSSAEEIKEFISNNKPEEYNSLTAD